MGTYVSLSEVRYPQEYTWVIISVFSQSYVYLIPAKVPHPECRALREHFQYLRDEGVDIDLADDALISMLEEYFNTSKSARGKIKRECNFFYETVESVTIL